MIDKKALKAGFDKFLDSFDDDASVTVDAVKGAVWRVQVYTVESEPQTVPSQHGSTERVVDAF
ncbi:MAG: hypothetical protein LC650_01955 [Actinobacteria bacterium]|nr:hypothetical protein [Actinomycetota bacterium]